MKKMTEHLIVRITPHQLQQLENCITNDADITKSILLRRLLDQYVINCNSDNKNGCNSPVPSNNLKNEHKK